MHVRYTRESRCMYTWTERGPVHVFDVRGRRRGLRRPACVVRLAARLFANSEDQPVGRPREGERTGWKEASIAFLGRQRLRGKDVLSFVKFSCFFFLKSESVNFRSSSCFCLWAVVSVQPSFLLLFLFVPWRRTFAS